MKIKLLVPWQTYNKGDVIDPPAAQAELMVVRGFAAYADRDGPGRKVLTARSYVTKGAGQKPAA